MTRESQCKLQKPRFSRHVTGEAWLPGPRFLLVVAILSLCATNLLTLFSDDFQRRAHAVLEPVVAFAVSTKGSTINQAKFTAIQLERVVATTTQLIAATEALQASVKGLLGANATLRVNAEAMAATSKWHMFKLAALQNAARLAAVSVAQRVAFSAKRGVTSLAPRLTPVAGIALSLAVTSLDVKDACESIRELNSLNKEVGERPHDEAVCWLSMPTQAELRRRISALN